MHIIINSEGADTSDIAQQQNQFMCEHKIFNLDK